MMIKSGLEFFYFKILLAMSIKPFWTDFLYWAAATLKGLVEFQNKKILEHFSPSFLSQKWSFQELKFWSTYSI